MNNVNGASSIADLEARVRELEDVREINELFRRFHHACTGGFDGVQTNRMEALDCLTEDATIELRGLHAPGKGPKGREELIEYWKFWGGDTGPEPYVFQTSIDQMVEVDGDEATQESNQLAVFYLRDASTGLSQTVLSLSRRKNWLIRTSEGWKITKTYGDSGLTAPLDDLIDLADAVPESNFAPVEGDASHPQQKSSRRTLNALVPQEPRTPWTAK